MMPGLARYVQSKRGWPGATAPLVLVVAMALVGLALLAACGSPQATPRPPQTATGTLTPAPSEGADEGLLTYDFSLAGIPPGEVVTRESLRADGKPYILYFFASW